MKKISYSILTALFAFQLLAISACNKEDKPSTETTAENTEPSLEQEAKMLKNQKGESIKVVYFAEGDEVAVKITINGKEHKLNARGSNNKGEPIFTDDTYAWEIMESGTSGRLTDKAGNIETYKPEGEQ